MEHDDFLSNRGETGYHIVPGIVVHSVYFALFISFVVL